MPEANAKPALPRSIAARLASSAARVGFWVRAYSYPLCSPSAACTYVEVWKIGVMMAPVPGSGSWPAWMQMVENCSRPESFTTGMLSFAH